MKEDNRDARCCDGSSTKNQRRDAGINPAIELLTNDEIYGQQREQQDDCGA
ncbi:MAG: hypothetical protein NTV22_10200 [bacterium]|nr:hypothetical protein [bacterium]